MEQPSQPRMLEVEEIDGYELTGVVATIQQISAGDSRVADALLELIEAGYVGLVVGDSEDLPRSA